MPGPTVILAALPNELAPSAQRLKLQRDDGGWVGPNLVALVSGVGRVRVLAALDAVLQDHAPQHVIHIGFAGGLDPVLRAGDVLRVGAVGLDDGQRITLGDGPLLLTCDHPAVSPEQKQALFTRHQAAAVDMESFYVARRLSERGVPLTVLRAISDPADQVLPRGILSLTHDDGRSDLWAAIRFVLRHPRHLPTLIRLGRHARLAARRLADAVERTLMP